jgi:thiamine phosphate synthase YjbQ (UPF0047 family)
MSLYIIVMHRHIVQLVFCSWAYILSWCTDTLFNSYFVHELIHYCDAQTHCSILILFTSLYIIVMHRYIVQFLFCSWAYTLFWCTDTLFSSYFVHELIHYCNAQTHCSTLILFMSLYIIVMHRNIFIPRRWNREGDIVLALSVRPSALTGE